MCTMHDERDGVVWKAGRRGRVWLVSEAADGLRPLRRAAEWCAESRRAVCGL